MVQLPALNTPQFDWARTKLPRKPQPVPPIFQPEVAAEAIFRAAHERRRELSVGWPTVKTVIGSKVASGIADLYLARTGYASQQRDEPVEPDRADNLFEPVEGDYAAHGAFDDRAKEWSLQLTLSLSRDRLALAAGTGLAAAAVALLARDGR
jgi:hypothetical protein